MFEKNWMPFVSAILILFLLVAGAVYFEETRLTRFMQSQLPGKAAELDRQLTQFAVVPRLLVKNPFVIEALTKRGEADVEAANFALLQAQVDSKASFAFVMDKQGNTIAASNYRADVSFVGVNYGFRPYFKEALKGTEATFFAVGATTGVPGYFVANPVYDNGNIVGVVVVKFDLAGLLDSWRLEPFEWLSVDEFGVVILSTVERYLYSTSQNLSEVQLSVIKNDRRYVPSEASHFEVASATRTRYKGGDLERAFFMRSHKVSVEDWELRLIVERSQVWFRVLLYLVALLAVASIIGLVYRNIRAQKRLVETERKYAMELEQKVQQRTDELHSAQETLISESNFAMLGRMSGAINHEINQPLASLRLNLASLRKLIEKPDADMAEVRQVVVDSDRTTKRIGRVVTTLRNLTSQKQTEAIVVDVERLVADVVETVRRERTATFPVLSVLSVESQLQVAGNEVLLQQALLNLLYNAFDAVIDETDPSVRFTIRSVDRFVEFEVRDNGCGVDEAVVPNLFKPFVSDKTRKSGLGLGLTLAELIANDHSGTLKYKPAPPTDCSTERTTDYKPASGSTFILSIPMPEFRPLQGLA